MTTQQHDTWRVSGTSDVKLLSSAIAGALRERDQIEMTLIGVGALNQAIKGIAIARGHLAPSGFDLSCVPSFVHLAVDGEDRTGIRLVVRRERP